MGGGEAGRGVQRAEQVGRRVQGKGYSWMTRKDRWAEQGAGRRAEK